MLGRGDETADRFERAGSRRWSSRLADREVSAAVLAALEPDAAGGGRGRREELAEEFRWDRAAAPLLQALARVRARGRRAERLPATCRGRPPTTRGGSLDRLLPSH